MSNIIIENMNKSFFVELCARVSRKYKKCHNGGECNYAARNIFFAPFVIFEFKKQSDGSELSKMFSKVGILHNFKAESSIYKITISKQLEIYKLASGGPYIENNELQQRFQNLLEFIELRCMDIKPCSYCEYVIFDKMRNGSRYKSSIPTGLTREEFNSYFRK